MLTHCSHVKLWSPRLGPNTPWNSREWRVNSEKVNKWWMPSKGKSSHSLWSGDIKIYKPWWLLVSCHTLEPEILGLSYSGLLMQIVINVLQFSVIYTKIVYTVCSFTNISFIYEVIFFIMDIWKQLLTEKLCLYRFLKEARTCNSNIIYLK